jgi:TRAP-type C4-dicarboxylate transport system substrate-binding protein
MSIRIGLVSGLAAAAMMAGGALAQEISFSTFVPPAEISITEGVVPLFAKATEASGGKFKAKVFTAGQMFGPLEVFNGIRDRAVDAGFIFETFAPSALGATIIFNDLQGLNNDARATIGASLETFWFDCPQCLKEWDDAGIVPITGHSTDAYNIICNKEITSVEDLKGIRMRSSTPHMAAITEAYGAVGVNVAFPEITQALERGQFDCLITLKNWILSFGLQDIIKTVITTRNFGALPTISFITFNREAWEELDAKAKEVIVAGAADYASRTTIGFMLQGPKAIEETKAHGLKEVDLGEPFVKIWEQFREKEKARVAAAAKARGVADPDPIIEKYLENYAKWEKLVEPIGMDTDKLTALLQEHVFSKVTY